MPKITIDDLEIERRDDPFVFETSDGQEFTFADPKAMPIETILDIQKLSREDQLKAMLPEGQFEALKTHPEIDGYAFDAIVRAWRKHYGDIAVGEVDASSR